VKHLSQNDRKIQGSKLRSATTVTTRPWQKIPRERQFAKDNIS